MTKRADEERAARHRHAAAAVVIEETRTPAQIAADNREVAEWLKRTHESISKRLDDPKANERFEQWKKAWFAARKKKQKGDDGDPEEEV